MPVRFFWLFIVPNALFVFISLFTQATTLIAILNAALFAGAAGVCLAYAPPVISVMSDDRPIDRADFLGIGIFCSWFAIVIIRAWSIIWRWMGKPDWLLDSDIVSYALYMQLCAMLLHLAAPGALKDRIPAKRWINIGVAVAVIVFAALILGYLFDALALE